MDSITTYKKQLLHKIVRLAECYGLSPGDFKATVQLEAEANGLVGIDQNLPKAMISITFTMEVDSSIQRIRFNTLMETLDACNGIRSITGTYSMLLRTLDRALEIVPPQ